MTQYVYHDGLTEEVVKCKERGNVPPKGNEHVNTEASTRKQ